MEAPHWDSLGISLFTFPSTRCVAWSGSRVSGSHMTLKTLELLGLAQNFTNFSDFEFLTQVSTLVILGRGSCSKLAPTQLAGTEKATPGLRGLSGPAGD